MGQAWPLDILIKGNEPCSTADWVMSNSMAARLRLPTRTTARKVLIETIFIRH